MVPASLQGPPPASGPPPVSPRVSASPPPPPACSPAQSSPGPQPILDGPDGPTRRSIVRIQKQCVGTTSAWSHVASWLHLHQEFLMKIRNFSWYFEKHSRVPEAPADARTALVLPHLAARGPGALARDRPGPARGVRQRVRLPARGTRFLREAGATARTALELVYTSFSALSCQNEMFAFMRLVPACPPGSHRALLCRKEKAVTYSRTWLGSSYIEWCFR